MGKFFTSVYHADTRTAVWILPGQIVALFAFLAIAILAAMRFFQSGTSISSAYMQILKFNY